MQDKDRENAPRIAEDRERPDNRSAEDWVQAKRDFAFKSEQSTRRAPPPYFAETTEEANAREEETRDRR
ncbi:hypothetical protein ACFSM5_09850 [Lacibacterium aquatile]|uniref:Uncharacterized protein n=1 Tax=Lacibacterium aquatile TaxID=1168082 RepID=A0ABW5DRT0_9PROT